MSPVGTGTEAHTGTPSLVGSRDRAAAQPAGEEGRPDACSPLWAQRMVNKCPWQTDEARGAGEAAAPGFRQLRGLGRVGSGRLQPAPSLTAAEISRQVGTEEERVRRQEEVTWNQGTLAHKAKQPQRGRVGARLPAGSPRPCPNDQQALRITGRVALGTPAGP